jgi:hypothetical protein
MIDAVTAKGICPALTRQHSSGTTRN